MVHTRMSGRYGDCTGDELELEYEQEIETSSQTQNRWMHSQYKKSLKMELCMREKESRHPPKREFAVEQIWPLEFLPS